MSGVSRPVRWTQGRWDGGGCPDCAVAYGHRESCPRASASGLPKYPDRPIEGPVFETDHALLTEVVTGKPLPGPHDPPVPPNHRPVA